MVKAIYEHGNVRLLEPAPGRWSDGQSLVVQEPAASNEADLRREFDRLTDQWDSETTYSSSMSAGFMHPAYQRIIGMGSRVLPWILHDLRRTNRHWFWALRCITGENPVPESLTGRVAEMADAWVRWGRERGLVDASS